MTPSNVHRGVEQYPSTALRAGYLLELRDKVKNGVPMAPSNIHRGVEQ